MAAEVSGGRPHTRVRDVSRGTHVLLGTWVAAKDMKEPRKLGHETIIVSAKCSMRTRARAEMRVQRENVLFERKVHEKLSRRPCVVKANGQGNGGKHRDRADRLILSYYNGAESSIEVNTDLFHLGSGLP